MSSTERGKPQPLMANNNSKLKPHFFNAFRITLPPELRQKVYGYLYHDCNLTEEEQELIHDPNAETQHMILSYNNHDKIRTWLQKASAMAVINTLKLASPKFAEELTAYEALKSSKTCPRIALEILWLEDLGGLLQGLGHEGRKNFTSVRFQWSDQTRADLGHATASNHKREEYYGDAGKAKVFKLLADCPNLMNLDMQFDSLKLANIQPYERQLQELESFQALKRVRLGPNAHVDLEYHMSYGRYWGMRANLEARVLDDLKKSMLRPREEDKDNI